MKRIIFILCLLLLSVPSTHSRKITTRLKGDNEEYASEKMSKGSFMVASQCLDCNNGYRIDSISFAGFDKPGASTLESFFITNHTDRTMSGVALYIEYLTPDGRQLHKRWLKLDCSIPPGETRKADIKSWDTQKSFHYIKSVAGRHSSPFTVVFDPVAFWLRF